MFISYVIVTLLSLALHGHCSLQIKQDRSNWEENVISLVRYAILNHFNNSRCLHVKSDKLMDGLIEPSIQDIPVFNTDLKKGNCINYLITLQDFNINILNNSLPRNAKYLVFTSDGGVDKLQEFVTQEMFLDFKVSEVNFKSMTSPEQLGISQQNGIVDLQGRHLSVSTFHNSPFVVNKNGLLDGIEIRVLRALADTLNFTWSMHEPLDGQMWGEKDDKGQWTGLKGELANGKTDIGIASLYLNEEHYTSFALTYPYTMMCLTFLVPAPKKLIGNLDSLLKPLRFNVWMMFLLIATLRTIVLYIISKRSISSCVLETVRVAALISGPQQSGPISQRILFLSWIVGCFLVAGLYGSELSAWLVTQSSEAPLRTLDDLAKSNVIFTRQEPFLAERLSKSSSESMRLIAKKFKLEQSYADIEKHILKGGYSIFVHVLSDGYPSGAEFLSREARDKLVALQECFSSEFVSLGLRRGLPLVRAANRALRHLEAAGLLEEWQSRNVRMYGDGANYKNKQGDDNKMCTPFNLTNLAGAFALYVLGLLLAIFSFCVELFMFKINS